MWRTLLLAMIFCPAALAQPSAEQQFDAKALLETASREADESTARKVASFKLADPHSQISISPDGKRVAAFGASYELFDADTGKSIGRSAKLPGIVASVEFAPKGELVIVSTTKDLHVINMETGEVLADIPGADVAKAAFLDETTVQLIQKDTTLFHHDTKTKRGQKWVPFEPTELPRGMVGTHSPDGKSFTSRPFPKEPWKMYVTVKGNVMPVDIVNPPELVVSAVMSNRYLAAIRADGKVDIRFYEPLPDRVFYVDLGKYPLRARMTGHQNALSISSDEKWLMHVGRNGVELRPLEGRLISTVHYADLNGANSDAAPDVMRVVGARDGAGVVYQLPLPPSKSPSNEFISQLYRLLKGKRFDELDSLGEILADDDKPFSWAPDQPKYDAMVQLLVSAGAPKLQKEERQALLDEWYKAKPNSHLARLLQIREALSEGWDARGEGLAMTVTPEGWRVFRDKVEEAHELLKPLLEEDDAPLERYVSLFEIAKAKSWTPEQCEPHIQMLLKRNAKYLTPHIAMAEKLMRRWGGTVGDDQKYVARVADAIGGPEGDAVYAQLATKIAIYEAPADFFDVSGFDYERIQRGWRHLQEIHPRPDYGVVGELFMAGFRDDSTLAKGIVKRVEREHLHYVPGVLAGPTQYYALLDIHGQP